MAGILAAETVRFRTVWCLAAHPGLMRQLFTLFGQSGPSQRQARLVRLEHLGWALQISTMFPAGPIFRGTKHTMR